MAFKLENFGAEIANAKGTLGGICYYRYFNENGDTLTNSGYFPANLGLEVGDRIRVIPKTNTDADEIYIVTSIANRTVVVKQVDTDGAVDSVNGKTGAVVLGAQDVGAVPQYSSMPTASEDELGNIYQFTGTTDANYTNGYFYKCVSDGQDPATYSWSQVSVQPAPSGLPDQTGQSGKFLTTDGTDASWGTINALQNTATGTNALTILGTATSSASATNIGSASQASSTGATAFGRDAHATGAGAIAIGMSAYGNQAGSIAIGRNATASAVCAIQIAANNSASTYRTNSDANTFKVANGNGNFELMNANGNLPADRLASTTGLADGNYRLRLVMASGVPTLEWVAE